jgi:hypothetical protein
MTLVTLFTTLLAFSSLTLSSFAVPRASSGATTKLGKVTPGAGTQIFTTETRLRAQQPVVVQRTLRGGVELRHANVEVANVGSVSAKGIQVYIQQAGGVAYALKGPKELLPHEHGTYILNSRVVGGTRAWTVQARCSTCRR